MDKWTAQITGDPRNGYRLMFDLWEGDEHRANVEHDENGRLVLTIYASSKTFAIPADWLMEVLMRAKEEVPPDSSQSDA
jgi:hypothetical protein